MSLKRVKITHVYDKTKTLPIQISDPGSRSLQRQIHITRARIVVDLAPSTLS